MKLDIHPKIIESTKVEQVAPQKLEYKLVGSYFRTKGLSLYCYNQLEDTISLVVETYLFIIPCLLFSYLFYLLHYHLYSLL